MLSQGPSGIIGHHVLSLAAASRARQKAIRAKCLRVLGFIFGNRREQEDGERFRHKRGPSARLLRRGRLIICSWYVLVNAGQPDLRSSKSPTGCGVPILLGGLYCVRDRGATAMF